MGTSPESSTEEPQRLESVTLLSSRLERLQAVTSAFARALVPAEVADVIVSHAMALIGADAGAVHRFAEDGKGLVVLKARGPELARAKCDAPEWSEAAPAWCCVPLEVDGRHIGTLSFGFHGAHRFAADEQAFIATLAHQCAQALDRARLYEDERRSNERLRLLADVSTRLASSLDYDATLANLAIELVPRLADWCVVDLLERGAVPRAVAIAHVDPAKVTLGKEVRRRYPVKADDPGGVMKVIRTGQSELIAEVPDDLLVHGSVDAEHLALLRSLAIRSVMIVPLRAREKTLGALTLVSSSPTRRYTPADLAFIEELASRAALAVSNVLLYREAREAAQLRDDFLSIASHELKTPLTSLRLTIEILQRRQNEPEKLGQRLANAERQVSRLTSLISQMLDVSRIAGGHLRVDTEPVDLSAVVRDVAERFEDELSRAGSMLELRLTPDVVGEWDRMRLEQVVTNLLSNAIKYGEGRPVEVRVEGTATQARLTVKDSGIGIDAEHQERIFRRFERAVSIRHYGGFAVGLWLTREIVGAFGGTVTVESAPGKGAAFVVELPKRR